MEAGLVRQSPMAERRRIRKAAKAARDTPVNRRGEREQADLWAEQRAAERERWQLRARLRQHSTIKRQRACGLAGVREDGSVSLRVTDVPEGRKAGFAGLMACGNVWTCPECSRKVAAVRSTELERVMGHYLGQGGHAALVTLTLRHNRGQRLKELWDALAQAWAAVTSGRGWKDHWATTGMAGWVRATEVTHGSENGWHPHLHIIVLFHRKPSQDAMDALFDHMWSRWQRKVVKLDLDAPERDNHGMDVQHVNHSAAEGKLFESATAMARYVAKGLSMEATLGAQKQAKNGNRTTMELLRDAYTPYEVELADGTVATSEDETAQRLWREYEQASKGRRQLEPCRDKDFKAVWKSLADTAEQSDEEIAAEELGDRDDDVAIIPGDQWPRIQHQAWELKHVARRDGVQAAYDWLNERGVTWYRGTSLSSRYRQHAAKAGQ